MRIPIILAPVLLGLTLAACSTATGPNRYRAEEQRLSDECEARGGILTPTGRQSGRAQLDNVCEIRGGTAIAPRPAG